MPNYACHITSVLLNLSTESAMRNGKPFYELRRSAQNDLLLFTAVTPPE